MILASAAAPDQPEAPHVLPLPGVPLSPKQAKLRAEIVTRLENTIADFEDADTLMYWNVGTYHQFRPLNAWQDWLTQQAALHMMRINRSERIERRLRDIQALRAIDCWEADQEQAAHALGANLANDPARTVAALWCTPAGCDWMIERWETLAATPASDWTEAQQALAQHLCPAPVEHHQTPGYARMRILNLVVKRDRLRAADDSFRTLVESDLSPEPSTMLAKLRSYTRSLYRQLKWLVAELRAEPPKREPTFLYHPDHARLAAELAAEEAARLADQAQASFDPEMDQPDPPHDHATNDRTNPRIETTSTQPPKCPNEPIPTEIERQ